MRLSRVTAGLPLLLFSVAERDLSNMDLRQIARAVPPTIKASVPIAGRSAVHLATRAVEFHEQRDDGVKDDSLGCQEFSHVENKLLGRDVLTHFVFLLKCRDRQLPFGSGLHQAANIGIVHRLRFQKGR